jgi:hypothetical protein
VQQIQFHPVVSVERQQLHPLRPKADREVAISAVAVAVAEVPEMVEQVLLVQVVREEQVDPELHL